MSAEFRSVQTRMWREDDWFQNQPTDARLLFIYLFTNPSASVSGIYRLPLRTMAFESGLSVERVTELLAQFAVANKAHYEDGVVWVVKMRENQLPAKKTLSPQIATHLATEIEKIPAGHLKNMYLHAYGHPIDTLSIPYGCTTTDTDTVTDTETKVVVVADSPVNETGAVFSCWQNNMPGTMTPVISDDLADLVTTYGANEVINAITEATRANARNMRYVCGILRKRQNHEVKPAANGNGKFNGVGKVTNLDRTNQAFSQIEEMMAKGNVV